MYNNNGLPAAANSLESGPYNLSLQQPPIAVQYGGPQVMQQFMPTICACTALEIQSQVYPQPKNALRIFMFNLFSRNGFNTAVFVDLVTLIADMAAAEHMAGRMPDIASGLPALVVAITETMAGAQVQQYPGLTQYLDPSFQQPVQGHIQNLQGFRAAVEQAKRGGQQPVQQQAWNQGNAGGQWGQSNQGSTHWAAAGGYQQPPQQVQTRTMVGVSASGLFTQAAPAAVTGAPQGPGSRYARDYGTPAPAVQEPVYQQAAPQVETVVVTEAITSTSLKWKPSEKQPYPPAYNPRKADMYLSQDPETSNVTVGFVEKDNKMDYSRHVIPSVFGPLPGHYSNAAAMSSQERIGRGLKTMEDEVAERKEDPELPPVTIQATIMGAPSVQDLWTSGSVSRYRFVRNEELPAVYSFRGEVNTVFVSARDEASNIKKLADSITYAEVREKLLGMRAAVLGAEPWRAAEVLMTKHVNETLSKKMSMAIQIDSFVEDYPDLVKILKDQRGELMYSCFLKDEQKCIARLFKAPLEVLAAGLTEHWFSDEKFPEGVSPVLSFLSKRYSMTMINSTSFNLELEFDPKVASGLTKTRTPDLLKLAKIIFEQTKDDEEISHRFIRTTDGRVMELTRGNIGEDFYLISLVD